MTDAIHRKYRAQRAHREEVQLPVPIYESEYYVREAQCGNLDMLCMDDKIGPFTIGKLYSTSWK